MVVVHGAQLSRRKGTTGRNREGVKRDCRRREVRGETGSEVARLFFLKGRGVLETRARGG